MELQRKGFSMWLISGRVGNIKDRISTVGGADEVRNKGPKIGETCLLRLHMLSAMWKSRSGSRGGRVLGVSENGWLASNRTCLWPRLYKNSV